MSDRETLEAEAKRSVCACHVYTLANDIDQADDGTLQNIIDDPKYIHKHMQENDPVSAEEYAEELADCTG